MIRYLLFSLIIILNTSFTKSSEEKRILIFSKTEGYRHESIPKGIEAVMRISLENGILVDTTEDASVFNEKDLSRYDAVIFLNTEGNILNNEQQLSFQRYIQEGGGFVGIHSATATEHEWPWYGKLVGGYFVDHPKIQKADINVVDKEHISTQHLPEKWERTDEWYNFSNLNPDVTVLATLDESTYTGGTHPDHHPIAWYHEFDGGRAFYTALGHLKKNYDEPELLQHILGGINWAMGNNPKSNTMK